MVTSPGPMWRKKVKERPLLGPARTLIPVVELAVYLVRNNVKLQQGSTIQSF
jgi:hypothetical protein